MPSIESSDLTSSAATPLCSNADHIAATAGNRDLDSGDPATSACPLFEALQTENARFEHFGFCEGFRPPGMRASPSVVAAGGRKAQCTKSRDGNDGRTARYGDFAAGSGTHLTRIEGSTINSAGITACDPGRGRAGGRFARGK